jgi:hypothetical protein
VFACAVVNCYLCKILINPIKLFMKKILTLAITAFITFTSLQSRAQAFDRNTTLLTLAIGPGEMIHLPVGNNNPLTLPANTIGGPNVNRAIITGQFSFQAEFAVHKYVGVGFAIGVGGRTEAIGSLSPLTGVYDYGYAKEVNVPIAVLANFHFYQLIADKKSGKNIHADKLDIYAGVTAGSGVAIHPYTPPFNDVLLFIGPHAGVNYYFVPGVAVHGEVGWGVTVIQAGFTFKLGGSKAGSKK